MLCNCAEGLRFSAFHFLFFTGCIFVQNFHAHFLPVCSFFFQESLDRVETMYRTCLNDAMMEAVTQLKQYTRKYPQCKRYNIFILCD